MPTVIPQDAATASTTPRHPAGTPFSTQQTNAFRQNTQLAASSAPRTKEGREHTQPGSFSNMRRTATYSSLSSQQLEQRLTDSSGHGALFPQQDRSPTVNPYNAKGGTKNICLSCLSYLLGGERYVQGGPEALLLTALSMYIKEKLRLPPVLRRPNTTRPTNTRTDVWQADHTQIQHVRVQLTSRQPRSPSTDKRHAHHNKKNGGLHRNSLDTPFTTSRCIRARRTTTRLLLLLLLLLPPGDGCCSLPPRPSLTID